MDQHEIPDLSNLQKRRKVKVKVYEYLEIECIFFLSAKKDKFVEWLDNNRNDSFLDRFFGNLSNWSNYGKIQKIIFVHQNESKKKINGSITAVLNKYGRLGWELVAVRHEYLQEPPNYNLSDSDRIKYYRQTIYSLKRSLYVDANTISDFGKQLEAAFDTEPPEKSFNDFTEIEDLRFTGIEELQLSTKASRFLKSVGIETIGNFYDRKDDLYSMGMGCKNAEEVAKEVTEEIYKNFDITITFRTSR